MGGVVKMRPEFEQWQRNGLCQHDEVGAESAASIQA